MTLSRLLQDLVVVQLLLLLFVLNALYAVAVNVDVNVAAG